MGQIGVYDAFKETMDQMAKHGILLVSGSRGNPMTIGWGTVGRVWGRPVFVVLNFGLTISLSVVLTWLFLRTRSNVLLCTLLHAVFYTWGQAFLMADGGEGTFGVAVFFMWFVADILVIHNGANLRRTT